MAESALGRFDELTLHLKSTIEALIIRAERAERENEQLRTELDRARRRSLANPGIVGVRIEGKLYDPRDVDILRVDPW